VELRVIWVVWVVELVEEQVLDREPEVLCVEFEKAVFCGLTNYGPRESVSYCLWSLSGRHTRLDEWRSCSLCLFKKSHVWLRQ
jgi:hypothetical protein